MTRLAVFDCDGTLIDSQASICRAMTVAFEQAGLVAPASAAVRRLVGLSLPGVVAALLPDVDTVLRSVVVDNYRRAFQGLRARGLLDEPLFVGVAEALAMLADTGWTLGVATGKSDRGLALALDAHGLRDRFATLQTADRHPSKPNPAMLNAAMAEAGASPETTVMIGDTAYDMAMAVAAGAEPVGVAWGYHDTSELRDAGARGIAAHPSELVTLLEAA